MKRTFLTFLGVSASLLTPFAVLASVVTVPQAFTIVLPSDSTSYTVRAGATYSSLTVSGDSFTFALDPQDQVIINASGQKLTNNQGIATICTSSSESSIVYAVATSSSGTSFITTPSGTCTVSTQTPSGGGGGGGGGSSGGSSSTPTPTPSPSPTASSTPTVTLTPVPSTKPFSVLQSTPAVLGYKALPPAHSMAASVSPVIILRMLAAGSQGTDVTTLQKFLASDASVYLEGIVSGYFGPKTRAAIQRFQEKYGIAKKGQQGYGVVGPKTRAKLKELSSGSVGSMPYSPTPSSSPMPPGSSVSAMQAQLKILQDMLKELQQKK